MPVFSSFMPAGAAIGGIGGALLSGIRDAEIAIERAGPPPEPRNPAVSAAFVQCKMAGCVSAKLHYFWSQQ